VSTVSVQAVLLAGDRGASRAVRGRSKAFLEVASKPMLVHVLEALLHTPEVSEVFVVGDAVRLEKTIAEYGCLQLAAARARPVHIVPQRSSLFENVWHTFLRTLPAGRRHPDHPILVVPSDIPLVVPEELSDFTRQAASLEADYVVGLTPAQALLPFAPDGEQQGVEMASFNLAEGRFRQSNLHFVRPLRLGNRHYIQDMYENRYQKEVGNMLRLGWRMLRSEFRNLWVLFPYLLMHVAAVLDRRGFPRASDRVRSWVSLGTVERGIGALLRTRFATTVTAHGGAALDVDNDLDLAIVDKNLERWKALQIRLAREATLPVDE
jgi:GTP:adenosylcobinamide-phosphate guanylyltransferase